MTVNTTLENVPEQAAHLCPPLPPDLAYRLDTFCGSGELELLVVLAHYVSPPDLWNAAEDVAAAIREAEEPDLLGQWLIDSLYQFGDAEGFAPEAEALCAWARSH